MPKLTVRYTPQAIQDISDIADYQNEHFPGSAERFEQRMKSIIERLAGAPRIGVPIGRDNIRKLTTNPFPYLVFYQVMEDAIVVLTIRHSARDPATMPGGDTPDETDEP
ncbi:MAG: type II toxin-antitoxin system RelE/ParE family toxin [Pseudomonadota bacterium]